MSKSKKILNIIYNIPLLLVVIFAFFIVFSKYPFLGKYKFYSVASGSMEPALKVGSLLIVQKKDDYNISDIITFMIGNGKNTVTHRIQKIEQQNKNILYQVKGDANNAPDSDLVLKENVIGKVLYSIPIIGFPVSFVKTQLGFILLVIVPATLLIYSELIAIKKEAVRLYQESKKRKLSKIEKIEEEFGEEEIKIEKGFKKFAKKIFRK